MGMLGLIIIIGVMFLMHRNGGCCGHSHGTGHHQHHSQNKSLQILQERYARGEIDKETYEQMKADLDDGSPHN